MKKILLTATMVLTIFSGFCQDVKPVYTKADYEDLMHQSKRKRTGGIIMAASGGALLLGGVVMMTVGTVEDYDLFFGTTNKNEGLITAGAIISLAGIGLGLGSIPMFKKSHNLKIEARQARVSMNTQLIPVNAGSGYITRIPQPQLMLTIPLGK